MAAWILVRIVQNHYFIDGNKRTALGTMLVFLASNNCKWTLPQKFYFFNLTINVATDSEIYNLEYVEIELEKIVKCLE